VQSWTGTTFDFRGQHFVLEGQRALPVPAQDPHPPLIMGGQGKSRSLALAARFAAEYNVAFMSVEDCLALRGRIEDACAAAGRDPATLPVTMMTLLAPGRDQADAESRLDRMSARFRGPRDRCYAGPVGDLVERLGEYIDAGVTRVYLQYPDRQDFEAIELFGELARAVSAGS
jgi:alkanesulfonate monooxygenase SsuD/methylene tetrahydromethanopterin reductase-like flavin-dependent oxidoreductase (luciferase family)